MKKTIEVQSRAEGDAIKAGLEDPMTRALVKITGALQPLTLRQRARVLGFVADQNAEENGG